MQSNAVFRKNNCPLLSANATTHSMVDRVIVDRFRTFIRDLEAVYDCFEEDDFRLL